MRSDKVFFWACDYSENSGEGRLGRLFIKVYERKFKLITKRIKPSKRKILNHKYVNPFIGILFAWIYFFKNKKFLFLNYLPYWNFLIFLFGLVQSKTRTFTLFLLKISDTCLVSSTKALFT